MIHSTAWLLFITLSAITALHLLWASGSTWPVADRDQFAPTFVGLKAGTRPPNALMCLIVAGLIFAAGLLPLWLVGSVDLPLPAWCKQAAPWVLFAVFALRGLSAYALPNLPRAEPFRTLDRHYFSPLCLILAAGHLAIALSL